MKAVEIGAFEAKTKFAELIEKVARGHEFLITRRGKPVARLIGNELASSVVPAKSRAWELYQKIQKSGPKLSQKQLDDAVRDNRAGLHRRTEKALK